MQLKYRVIKDHQLTNALVKLGKHPKFSPKFALQISKLIDTMGEQERKISGEYALLIKEHAKMDEKGEFIPREDHEGKPQPNTFEPHDREKWETAHVAFGEKTFRVPTNPLPLKELEGVGLTPLELRAIEPLVTEIQIV